MAQMHTVRIFEPTAKEYEAIVHVYNSANPHDPGKATTWQHWDQHRDPKKLFSRYVVEHRKEIVGYGYSLRTDPDANIFRFAIFLLPEWDSADLIHQFYGYIVKSCLDHAPTALICQTVENDTTKIAWLKGRGFFQVMRYPRSSLKLDDFNADRFDRLRANVAGDGIKILTLADLKEDDNDWQKKVYDLEMLLSEDVPRPTAFSPPPFDKYVQREFEDPDFIPELWLIALDGDAYIGMTSLFRSGKGIEMMETGLTGIHRDYRRRGLATVLKCQAIEKAKRLGARHIHTSNEENNPMYQLNLRLGFRDQPADVDWKKTLDGSGAWASIEIDE